MQRELHYQVPFDVLAKIGRSAGRKAYRSAWYLNWLLIASFLVAVVLLIVFGDALDRSMRRAGISYSVEASFILVCVLMIAAVLWLRRFTRGRAKARTDYDQTIHFTQDDGGLRFATAEIETYLKWQGITQLLVEHNAVVVSHANLFYVVPNSAFASADARIEFIRDVYGRLSDKARAISERYVRAAIGG